MAFSKEEQTAFAADVDAMSGGLLPHYLANESAPPEGCNWMRATTPAGVCVWVAASGAARVYGHYRPA